MFSLILNHCNKFCVDIMQSGIQYTHSGTAERFYLGAGGGGLGDMGV